MGLFSNLTSEGHEENVDRLGGGFQVPDTDVYPGKLKVAYLGESDGGARSVTLIIALESGVEHRETLYVTSGRDKGQKTYYEHKTAKDEATGQPKKISLPSFVIIDELCLITTDKPLSEQEGEEKVVNIYDPEAKKELPKSVMTIAGLTGADVLVAIQKSKVDKTKKEGDEYVPTGETREEATIEKFFHPKMRITVTEAKAGKTAGEFIDAWLEKNKGKVRDKTSKAAKGQAGAEGRPGGPPQSGATAPRKSLFGG